MKNQFGILFILGLLGTLCIADQYNETLWDELVHKYVGPNQELSGITLNTVDYAGISKDTKLAAYLDQIANANLDNMNATQLYTFFVNVYNAFAINMIVAHPCIEDIFGSCGPIKSIRDIGTWVPFQEVWDKPAGKIAGKTWSLQQVEDYLRMPPNGISEDPRLHAAIVCASISCPNIRNEAYTMSRLHEQLTDNFNNFVSNTKKGMSVDTSSKTVTLSSIFNWYASDFTDYASKATGNSKATVIDFILLYLYENNTNYQFLKENKDSVSLEYFSYNWDVNANGDVPCDSKDRPCYQLWALLVTLGCIFIVALVVVLVIVIRRYRKKKAGYTELATTETK